MADDVMRLVRTIRRQGCEVQVGGRGHWQVRKDGRLVAVFPKTMSRGRRAWKNTSAQLRRAGIDPDGRK